ncbi:tungsten cofactor oxidoreductase radical SAM maturase [Pyrococcus abyssi]|uniref:Tungsten-containing aldehyde ferredoxin oxidoreductase cofactor modifying protein n=1 Tax=Pyrococcus abyssi (strain GE5 / Orsay) TaxID=272844 RepID=Q9V033_PYRAB|nr:tungsten cofactor oxidoreductase radical SAM maturase [Pyrococcus abyssi]CAB49873.1 cmo tungsten-containing aldehyde ferredoxin oxidoreductase cofactor modifying protein [Pyrococcus abyssi GE5]CCE70371.1 TPA: tungsten-containing aldehyde ferredoxin oxidoreductase cofactor modifying protein [Pyrococcus abyssi GE5]
MEFQLWGAKVSIEPKPDLKYLYLEITNRCNLKCEMCFKQYWEDEEGDMDWELFLKVLGDAEELPELKMIYFGGIGEPSVHPRFMDMVREVKERGFRLGMSSNGVLLNDKILEEFVKLGVDVIYFSMDAIPTGENLIKLGHVTSKIVENRIKKLVELKEKYGSEKPTIGVEVVATKENYKELPDMALYLRKLGVDSMLISNLIPLSKEHSHLILYDGSVDMTPIVNKLHSIAEGGPFMRIAEFKLRTERYCDFVENNVTVVRWDGEVFPCYRFLHTYPEVIFGREKKVIAHSFGNVREKSLKEIWMSEEYVRFRFIVKASAYPSCIDCPLNTSCSFVLDTEQDCWGTSPSCGDCLWSRRIVLCPIPYEYMGKFL